MRSHLASLVGAAALAGAAPLPSQGKADPQQAGAPPVAPTTFVDTAVALGVDVPSLGRGAAMLDLDGDGRLDLICANTGMQNVFLQQQPDGTFVNRNSAWGIPQATKNSFAVVAADFDNDGDPDVFFSEGGWSAQQKNTFLRNDLNTSGRFVDVSGQSGAAGTQQEKTFGATALDFDRDGLLDLFLSNSKTGTFQPTCQLLRNEGNLVFRDVSAAAGIVHPGSYTHCNAGDFDGDGWDDVGVGSRFHVNRLYRNNGDGTFTDIAAALGVDLPTDTFNLVIEDFDNDGLGDLYLPRYQFRGTEPSLLFLNNGDGTIRNVTAGSGMTRQSDMGHNTGDLDADGYPDIFIGTGSPTGAEDDLLHFVRPNGRGGLDAPNLASEAGVTGGGPTRQHGVAIGDYDRDGQLDIYNNNGGPVWKPQTWDRNTLWNNLGNENRWIRLDLEGVVSNRSAVGAHAIAVTSSGREIHRRLAAGKGFGNTDEPTIHFGLESELLVDRLVVRWPSGIEQVLLDPSAHTTHSMLETGILLEQPPVAGGTMAVSACGAPQSDARFFFSFGTDEIRLPLYGGIRRLADPVRDLGSVRLDAQGHGSATFPVPNQAGLIGRDVYVQAWIHPSGSPVGGTISNLLATSIQ